MNNDSNKDESIKIFGLDPSNHCGFCVGNLNGKILISGTKHLKKSSEKIDGERLVRFWSWLEEINSQYKPSLVVYEAARSMKNYTGLIAIAELCGIIKLFCENHGIPYIDLSIKTIKKEIVGSGNADKKDMIKAINKLYKIKVCDDNEADGIGVYTVGMRNYDSYLQIAINKQSIYKLKKKKKNITQGKKSSK